MARASASKTRGLDKPKVAPAQAPVVTRDVVPGKFTDTDWSLMLDTDGSVGFITEIVDELMDTTMDVIFKQYLDRQLFPFTIALAKDALIEIIEWQFLRRDEGEENIETDSSWTMDEEPEPAETDCWAQGAMPKTVIITTEPLAEISDEINFEMAPVTEILPMEESPHEKELPDSVSETEEPPDAHKKKHEKVKTLATDDSVHKRPKRKQTTYISPRSTSSQQLPFKAIREIVAHIDDKEDVEQNIPPPCSLLLKTENAVWSRDAAFDDQGNIVAVVKIDPDKLPTHRVNIKFTVIDPNLDSVLSKSDFSKKKKNITTKSKTKSLTIMDDPLSKVNKSKVTMQPSNKSKVNTRSLSAANVPSQAKQKSSIPSVHDLDTKRHSVFEEIEVSQGIIVREKGQVKKGPGRYHRTLDFLEESEKGMKPVTLRLAVPNLTVADILDRQTPVLRTFGDSPPLPPIVPQHEKQVS